MLDWQSWWAVGVQLFARKWEITALHCYHNRICVQQQAISQQIKSPLANDQMSPLVCSTSRQSIRVSGGVCHFPFQHPRPRYGCLKILASSHTHSMHVIQYKNTQNFRIQHSELHPTMATPDGLFSWTTWASRYQKSKTSPDLNESRDYGVLGCSGISWTTCKQSAPGSRQRTTPTPHHSIFTGRMLFLMPNRVKTGTKLLQN